MTALNRVDSMAIVLPPKMRVHLAWLLAALGLLLLYGPTVRDLSAGIWSTDEQAHGPIVLALSAWLVWRRWPQLSEPVALAPSLFWSLPVVSVAALLYAAGRSQGILLFEMGSLPLMLIGLVLLLQGPARLQTVWFPLFFTLFLIPLPSSIVDPLTQPMKLAVSQSVEWLLESLGYPIARAGVTLYLGPYQLLVANACAGLNTLFTLEAIGLLYLNVVRSPSIARNVVLGTLIVPISFSANVIRVLSLCLITYYLGDEAGRGFLHGFAGMVLFASALALTIMTDGLISWLLGANRTSTQGLRHAE